MHFAAPLPLQSGFSIDVAYRALGIYSPSETSECYLVLSNDRNEIWFISNRHLRVVGVFPERRDLSFPLAVLNRNGALGLGSLRYGAEELSLAENK